MPHDAAAARSEPWDVSARTGPPPLHADCAPLRDLVGTWRGHGEVDYPTINGPHRFMQELVIGHDGRPFLSHAARAWLVDQDGAVRKPAARESGWWRPGADGQIELLLTHPTGIVEIFHGAVPFHDAAPDARMLMLCTSVVHCSTTAKEVTAGERHYRLVEPEVLRCTENRAMVGQPLDQHVTATLHRVPD